MFQQRREIFYLEIKENLKLDKHIEEAKKLGVVEAVAVVEPLGEVDQETDLVALAELRNVQEAREAIADDQVGDEDFEEALSGARSEAERIIAAESPTMEAISRDLGVWSEDRGRPTRMAEEAVDALGGWEAILDDSRRRGR